MVFDVVVIVPFSSYEVGNRITDPVVVSSILASPNAGFVVRVAQGQPAPTPRLPDVSQVTGGGYLLRVESVERFFSLADLQALLTPLLSGTQPPADFAAPTILTAPSQAVAENQAFSLILTANETVTWAITGGADAARFTLSGATLSMPAKDYEVPTDANGDSVYVVQVTATDTAGNVSAPLTISVTVSDVAEGGGTPSDLTTTFDDEANSALVPGLTA